MNFPNTWEIHHISITVLSETSKLTKENSKKSGLFSLHSFSQKILAIYMWFCKGKIVKIQATTQTFVVALFCKSIPTHKKHNHGRNYQNLLKLGTLHNSN